VLPLAQLYAELLAGPGVERGLIGSAETPRLWDRHLLNCAVVAELIPERCELADLGSGAGLPGIVLAMLRPQSRVILVEPMARRTAFLSECVELLGLANVTVRRARAEELAGRLAVDVVTARAVAPLDRLAALAAGLGRPGALVLAIKGREAAAELAGAAAALAAAGASGARVVTVGDPAVLTPATVVRFRLTGPARMRGGASAARPARRRSGIVLPRATSGAVARGARRASPGRGGAR
jgi:16S rRNA (guanine527-N7)-methyltransferase